jgi:hypothetical protein
MGSEKKSGLRRSAALLHRSFLQIGRLREEARAVLVRASVNFEFDGEIGI